ncbi:MAG: hypothetical protein LBD47_05285 [Treponema sp.]|jgi:hypothetical protein|nr:hypothetical protein [Treponema sp.]
MNITSIALDDFISAFSAALAGAEYKIAEQYLSVQNEMKEKYGAPIVSFVYRGRALHIKRGSITVMARPFLKTETGPGGKTERMYLKFNGSNTREMHFELALE